MSYVDIENKRKRKSKIHKAFLTMASCVVFVTIYMLILPAITLGNNAVCGFDAHQHDDSCFTLTEATKQLICADESDHVHDDKCYKEADVLIDQLVCKDTDENHKHDEACYTKVVKQELKCKHEHTDECKDITGNKELICENQHDHLEECYEVTVNKELICSQEHEHSDECFKVTEDKKLICDDKHHNDECYHVTIKETIVCKHEHTEDCYENVKEKQLTCLIHAHDNSCYEIIPGEQQLACQIPEHTHSASCYASVDSSVQEVINKINDMPSADEIDAELMKYDENEDYEGYEAYYTEVVKKVASTYNAYSKLTDEQKEKVTNADKLLELEYIWSVHILVEPIPLDGFIERVEMKHKKYYEDVWKDVVNGQVEMGDDLKFYLYFEIPGKTLSITNNTVAYNPPIEITRQEEGTVYDGDKEVGTYKISEDGTITIVFNDEYASKNANNADISGHIAFQSSVDKLESNTQGDASVTIKDEIKIQIVDKVNNNEDLQVNKEAFNVNAVDGTVTYEIKVSSANGTGGEVVLRDVMTGVQLKDINQITVKNKNGNTVNVINRQNTGDGFILTLPKMGSNSEYTITYTAIIKDISTLNGRKEFKNDVIVTSTDNVGGRLQDDDTTTQTVTRDMLGKSGKKNGDYIDWTITINKSGVDISGWTLRDQLQGNEYRETVTIAPNPLTGNGSITTTLPYTFPSSSKRVTYTVTYSTPAVSNTDSAVINNTAILTSPNGGNIQAGTGVNSRENQNGLDKIALGTEPSEQGDDGLAIFNWKVVFNATEQALEPYEQTIDKVRENVWIFKDELWNENIHWITGAQLKELKTNLEIALNGKYDSTFKIIAYKWDGTGGTKFRDPLVVDESLPDENKYSQFAIVFYGTLEKGNKIEVEYSSTVNVGGSSSKVSVTNYAFLNEKESVKQPSQSYTPVITKVDLLDPQGGNITYHEIDNLYKPYLKENVKGILAWDVYITFPKEINDDVYIIEKLPEGVTLLNEVISKDEFYDRSLVLEFGSSGKISGSAEFDFYEEGLETHEEYPYIAHHHFKLPNSNPEEWIPVEARKNRNNTNEITIKVPQVIAELLEGVTNKLTVKVVINDDFDWDKTSKEFKNTAILNYGGKDLGQASHTQVIHSPRILKTIRGASDNVISYQLTINESRKDLLPDSDTLVIEDKLEFNKPYSGTVNANLMLSSVKAYKVLSDGTKVDITKKTSFTTSETEADNKIFKEFEMIVPDNERIIVEYNYRISGSIGTNVDILNTAVIKGAKSTVETDEYKYVLQIQESNAGATLSGIKITKVDADNHLVTLQGALFSLQELRNGEFVEIAQFDTNNEEGSFYTNELELKPNVAYQVIELEAPYGYERDPKPYKFMIAGSTYDTKPEDFDGKYLNNGDTITILNKKIAYELPETGGIGTHLYYIGGITFVLISLSAYLYLNRKERCNE